MCSFSLFFQGSKLTKQVGELLEIVLRLIIIQKIDKKNSRKTSLLKYMAYKRFCLPVIDFPLAGFQKPWPEKSLCGH